MKSPSITATATAILRSSRASDSVPASCAGPAALSGREGWRDRWVQDCSAPTWRTWTKPNGLSVAGAKLVWTEAATAQDSLVEKYAVAQRLQWGARSSVHQRAVLPWGRR